MEQQQNSTGPKQQKRWGIGQIVPLIILAGVFITIGLAQTGKINLPKINVPGGGFNLMESHTYGSSCTSSGTLGIYGSNGDCYTCSVGVAVKSPLTGSSCSGGTDGVYCCVTKSTKCPTLSSQTDTPCHSVSGGIGVYGVIVPGSCPKCPDDTTFAQMDNVTPGGPYRICTCK